MDQHFCEASNHSASQEIFRLRGIRRLIAVFSGPSFAFDSCRNNSVVPVVIVSGARGFPLSHLYFELKQFILWR